MHFPRKESNDAILWCADSEHNEDVCAPKQLPKQEIRKMKHFIWEKRTRWRLEISARCQWKNHHIFPKRHKRTRKTCSKSQSHQVDRYFLWQPREVGGGWRPHHYGHSSRKHLQTLFLPEIYLDFIFFKYFPLRLSTCARVGHFFVKEMTGRNKCISAEPRFFGGEEDNFCSNGHTPVDWRFMENSAERSRQFCFHGTDWGGNTNESIDSAKVE